MAERPWKAIETRVYTGDGGFDIRDLPNPIERAAFIVKAVNSHDALVKALEEIERFGFRMGADGLPYPSREGEIAKRALALVGGRSDG